MSFNKLLEDLAARAYSNEPCRICGELIVISDLDEAVFAGYSDDSASRIAHGQCYDEYKDNKEVWKHPT